MLRDTPSSFAIEVIVRSGSPSSCRAYATFSGAVAGRSAELLSASAGGGQALVGVGHDDRADELGQGSEDVEDGP